nr:MAG: RNA-dependent RNA polymerase [Longquan bat nodavirus 1]
MTLSIIPYSLPSHFIPAPTVARITVGFAVVGITLSTYNLHLRTGGYGWRFVASLAAYHLRLMCSSLYFSTHRLLFNTAPTRGVLDPADVARTILLDRYCNRQNTHLRRQFLNFRFNPVVNSVPVNHAHPRCANQRNWASAELDRFIIASGHVPYSLSMSNVENHRVSSVGSRLFYSSSDLTQRARMSPPHPGCIIKLVDVDYYLDINNLLSQGFAAVLYTFVPNAVAGVINGGEGQYFFDSHDQLITQLTPGTSYHHQLWNYSVDDFCAESSGRITHVRVNRLHLGQTGHQFILLEPMVWFPSLLRSLIDVSAPLERLRVSRNGFNVLRFLQHDSDSTSIAVPDQLNCVTIRTATLEAVLSKAVCDPRTFGPHHVAISLNANGVEVVERDASATLLCNYIRAAYRIPDLIVDPHSIANYHIVGAQDVVGLQFDPSHPRGRVLHQPIADYGAAPATDPTSAQVAVASRHHGYQPSRAHDSNPTHTADFLDYIAPSSPLTPYTIDQVEALQNRPTQRAGNERAHLSFTCASLGASTFLKNEPLPEFKPPRTITSVSADHRVRFSAYTYPIAEHLKTFHWYAFGKSPKEIGDSVQSLALTSWPLAATDFSRFDARHSDFFSSLELRFLQRAYPNDPNPLALYEAEVGALSHLGDHEIKHGFSRLTGSPCTSIFNTLINCYVSYMALRGSHSHVEAIQALGLYGGDDGLVPVATVDAAVSIAASCGAKLTFDYFPSTWVVFLGRVYLDPLNTSASIYDLRRFVTKCHVTVAPSDVPLDVAARRKRTGYIITDNNTPLIHEWCHFVGRAYGEHLETEDLSWAATQISSGAPPFFQLPRDDHVVLTVCHELLPDFDVILSRVLRGCLRDCDVTPNLDPSTSVVHNGHLHLAINVSPPPPPPSTSVSIELVESDDCSVHSSPLTIRPDSPLYVPDPDDLYHPPPISRRCPSPTESLASTIALVPPAPRSLARPAFGQCASPGLAPTSVTGPPRFTIRYLHDASASPSSCQPEVTASRKHRRARRHYERSQRARSTLPEQPRWKALAPGPPFAPWPPRRDGPPRH